MKKFKLFDCRHSRDFGHDVFLYFGCYNRRWTLLQLCFGWSDYGAAPFLRIDFGLNHFMSFLLWIHKFTFELCVAGNAYYPEGKLKEVDT